MPLQNRVLPTGEIVAASWCGTLMGNRGILHDADRKLGRARWRHANWVCCVTAFRGRWREPMPPGRYTALFFRDEASALAAGHRPCAECRNRDYRAFKKAWIRAGLHGWKASEIDQVLHRARVGRDRCQVRHLADLAGLPDGSFFAMPGNPEETVLKSAGGFWRWTARGYTRVEQMPAHRVEVLTPKPIVEVLRAGYRPNECRTGADDRA